MFQWLKKWRHDRILRQSAITDSEWQQAFQRLSLLQRLDEEERTRLKELAILFLHYKSLEVVADLELTSTMRIDIALQACLPILNLGLDWYEGWVSVVIYPGAFSRQFNETDEYGIVHQGRKNLSGESWQRGPVVLSWDDSIHHGGNDGYNVVIHEFAHKLDMLNGRANGLPPLHEGMAVEQWSSAFNQAYSDLKLRLEKNLPAPVNPYAATAPAEFFAVVSEVFFEKPAILREHYPEVYHLLTAFYRQQPLSPSI